VAADGTRDHENLTYAHALCNLLHHERVDDEALTQEELQARARTTRQQYLLRLFDRKTMTSRLPRKLLVDYKDLPPDQAQRVPGWQHLAVCNNKKTRYSRVITDSYYHRPDGQVLDSWLFWAKLRQSAP
jgi:hypothetical protein